MSIFVEPFFIRLANIIRKSRTALCVGIDPRHNMLPNEIQQRHNGCANASDRANAYFDFCFEFLKLIRPYVSVLKFQIAFFEAAGWQGMRVLRDLMYEAKNLGFLNILDFKRGDILTTAEAYAEAAFDCYDADAVTVNPYMGSDAVLPFVKAANDAGAGVFVLCLTSNPGAGTFQRITSHGKTVYDTVAHRVSNDWSTVMPDGMRDVGLVIGATNPQELADLRSRYPNTWFLIPGYGAQGASAADCRAGFCKNGLGAIVNSSRGVMFPFKPSDLDWRERVVAATKKAASDFSEVPDDG